MSCIPSSVEMVLKLTGRVPASYDTLRRKWRNKRNGSLRNLDGKTIERVTFHLRFWLPRNSEFPLEQLFQTIPSEFQAGRFVIASFASGRGYHNWVIYDEGATGEFLAISKSGSMTIRERHVKSVITKMEGPTSGRTRCNPPTR